MSRIGDRFSLLATNKRKALIPYLVAGDPNLEMTISLMHEMVINGADLLELGVPFSDPIAEGPIIQAAHERALANDVDLKQVLNVVRKFREKDFDTPVILMGYANPVERMGYGVFASAATEAGLDALLTVDIPVEEIDLQQKALVKFGLDSILLIAPTSSEDRIRQIASKASGFLYSVALTGVTGAGHLNPDQVKNQISVIRRISNLPLVVGFGVKDKNTAKLIGNFCDGVVVGSAIIDCLARNTELGSATQNSVATFISELRKGLNEAENCF